MATLNFATVSERNTKCNWSMPLFLQVPRKKKKDVDQILKLQCSQAGLLNPNAKTKYNTGVLMQNAVNKLLNLLRFQRSKKYQYTYVKSS